jgi:hypothetical protein
MSYTFFQAQHEPKCLHMRTHTVTQMTTSEKTSAADLEIGKITNKECHVVGDV